MTLRSTEIQFCLLGSKMTRYGILINKWALQIDVKKDTDMLT